MTELINPQDFTILIIDDTAVNLTVMTTYLNTIGFEVLVANDGKVGLKLAIQIQPSLILLDVMMPGLDGFETCKRLKANPKTKDIPVIFMTALSNPEDKINGFEVGGIDYVTKPLQYKEVVARITTHLRLSQLNKQLEKEIEIRTTELNQAYRTLSLLDKTKSDFISVMSHELRTPMTLIEAYTELLKTDLDQVDKAGLDPILEGILAGTSRMSAVIEHILDITKIENSSLALFKEPLNAAKLIKEIEAGFASALDERQISLNYTQLANLSSFQADKILLSKVFYHLLSNSIKYTPDGGHITLSGRTIISKTGQTLIQIIVEDTGIGIDEDELGLIFEKFYQIGQITLHSSSKTSYKGCGPGLGLAIAKGIILAHQGKIWAKSEGHDEKKFPGTQIYLHLPA